MKKAGGQAVAALSEQARITLFNHGIYQFGNALSAVLLHLYLWRLTNDLWVNGLFHLTVHLVSPLVSAPIGKIAKMKDRLFAYRAGIFLTAAFYLAILLAGERIVDGYIAFAALRGIAAACYWLGHFTMITDVTSDANRHRYLGLNLMITNFAALAGPAIAGSLLAVYGDWNGYTLVFALAFLMFAVAAAGSLRIKRKVTHHRTYYLKFALPIMRKHAAYGRSLWGWFLFGLPQGVLAYIPPILLYQAIPEESFVHYMNVLFLGVTIASGYILARWGRSEGNAAYLHMAAWGFIAGCLPLYFGVSLWSVIVMMLIFSLMKPLQNNAYTSHYYRLSGLLPLGAHFRVEAVVLREVFTNAGRAAGVILWMVTSLYLEGEALKGMLTAAAAMQLLVGWLASPAFPKFSRQSEGRGMQHGKPRRTPGGDGTADSLRKGGL